MAAFDVFAPNVVPGFSHIPAGTRAPARTSAPAPTMAPSSMTARSPTVAPQETRASFPISASLATAAPIRTTPPPRTTARGPTVAPISMRAPGSSRASAATEAPRPTCACVDDLANPSSDRACGLTKRRPPAAARTIASTSSQWCPVLKAATKSAMARMPQAVAAWLGERSSSNGAIPGGRLASASRVRERLRARP